MEKFIKYDKGKLRYDLIPPEVLMELAKVLTYGANKYKPNNWKNSEGTERLVSALFRHIEAWRLGEDIDPGSGLDHLSHALTNLTFLIYLTKKGNNKIAKELPK